MEEAFWAARQGDALLHTSFMADVLGAVLEVAANVVIDAPHCRHNLVTGDVSGDHDGVHGRRADRFCGGCGDGVHRRDRKGQRSLFNLANMLFPPQIEGYILTGSGDTWINSKPAARQRRLRHRGRTLRRRKRRRRRNRKKRSVRRMPERSGMWPGISEMAGAIAPVVNPVTGPVLMSRALHDQLSTEEGRSEMVDGVTFCVGTMAAHCGQCGPAPPDP